LETAARRSATNPEQQKIIKYLKSIPMKLIIATLFLISNLSLFAQSNAFVGDYNRQLECPNFRA